MSTDFPKLKKRKEKTKKKTVFCVFALDIFRLLLNEVIVQPICKQHQYHKHKKKLEINRWVV